MEIKESLILGTVQGLTEYLPISSSAHLMIIPKFMNLPEGGLAFDVFLHFGTLLATVAYFWKDWMAILKNPLPKPGDNNLSWVHMIVATIPAALIGGFFSHQIEDYFRDPKFTAYTLSVFGVILYLVDRFRPKELKLEQTTIKQIFWVGVAQTLALVPGVSRSGSTITAARGFRFDREASARLSFLMSMPVTAGAVVFEGRHWHKMMESPEGMGPLLVGAGAAFVFGLIAIHGVLLLVRRSSYAWFMVYRVALAAAVFWLI